MTNITPQEAPEISVNPDSFHRFFVSYDAVLSPARSTSGFRTFSANKELINFHDINFLCEMIAEHLSKTYHTPVRDEDIALKNIIYLGYQDREAWNRNSYKDKGEDENLA